MTGSLRLHYGAAGVRFNKLRDPEDARSMFSALPLSVFGVIGENGAAHIDRRNTFQE